MRDRGRAPRWVRRGLEVVPGDVLERYRVSDERHALRQLDDRVLTPVQWHPVAAGVLFAFLMAFPLAPLAIGAGTTVGTVGVVVVCASTVFIGAALARSNLRHTVLPTLGLLRPGVEVPHGIEPHLYYLASWSGRPREEAT